MLDLELPRDACLGGVTKGTSLGFAFHFIHAIQSVGLISKFLKKNSTFQVPFMLRIHAFFHWCLSTLDHHDRCYFLEYLPWLAPQTMLSSSNAIHSIDDILCLIDLNLRDPRWCV